MRDPDLWNADDYMDEINSVANRGYSLAFHDGRLTNLAHDYESTGSTSFYEYAGRVIEWCGDDLIFEAKNRLVAGDVLEFLSPSQREPILIRLYEFDNISKNKIETVINAGQKPKIRIPASQFHLIDKEKLKELLPPFSLIRKEKPLDESEKLKVESRQLSHALEAGEVKEEKYQNKRNKYFIAKEIADDKISPRTPRIGLEGCCGKGCNGCLVFWHDEKYAKAREILKTKKIGEML